MDRETTDTVRRPVQPTLQRPFAFLALFLALTLLAGPALAQDQGQGEKKGHDKAGHPHAEHHDDDSDHVHHHDGHRMMVVSDDEGDHTLRLDTPQGEPVAADDVEIISLKARVTDLDTGREQVIDLDRADQHARIQVGDRVRVDLVGTAIIDGDGVAVQVPANFEIAAGSWRIDTAPAGPSSVIVTATQPNSVHRGNPEGRSGVGFEVVGNYDMKPKHQKGRVTFEIADREGEFGTGTVAGPAESWQPDARWRHSEEIAEDLSQIDFNPDALDRADLQRIYDHGMTGIREVAIDMAVEAGRSGAVRARDGADVVAHLYRHLLGRDGNTRAISQSDPQGFRNNLELLERKGYRALVTLFVDSDEFRRVHDLDAFDDLPRGEARWDDDSGDREDDYRRPRARDTRPN